MRGVSWKSGAFNGQLQRRVKPPKSARASAPKAAFCVHNDLFRTLDSHAEEKSILPSQDTDNAPVQSRRAVPQFSLCDPLCPLWLRVAFFAGFQRIVRPVKEVVAKAKIGPETKGLERPDVQISKAPEMGWNPNAPHVNPA
jgi:hypothetical protein